MTNLFSLEGKVVLITGASRGIGKAIANTLVAQGAKVAGTATSESGAAKISEYLGDNGKGYALNVTDPESIEATLWQFEDKIQEYLHSIPTRASASSRFATSKEQSMMLISEIFGQRFNLFIKRQSAFNLHR